MGSTRTVLVVEDDADIRDDVAFALRRRGYKVVVAADGDAADALLGHGPPDLLVTDMMLPGRSGFQLARRVKELSDGRVPVVMVSGNGSPAHQDYALVAGIDAFLPKPFTLEALVCLVAELCPLPRPGSGSRPAAHATVRA